MTAKMEKIAESLREALESSSLPYLSIVADDNICSGVTIRGSRQAKSEWKYNIFHNSPYFILMISSPSRYYVEGDKVTVELISRGTGIEKMRKYSGSPSKVVAKIVEWMCK